MIDIRRHNAAFCAPCFLHHCREQVRRAIDDYAMFGADERVLVAVSGGKDSLALWDILLGLGYHADGLYVGLGIGEYSDASGEHGSHAPPIRRPAARSDAAGRGASPTPV